MASAGASGEGGRAGTAGGAGEAALAGSSGASGANGGAGGGMAGPSVGGGVGSCPANLALKMPTMPASEFVAASPAWTTVDLGEEMLVNRVRYYSSAHAPTPAYDIALSTDNTTFTSVVHVDGDNYASFSNHCFEGQTVRYVKATVPTVRHSDNSGPGTEIRDLQVFGPGSKPE